MAIVESIKSLESKSSLIDDQIQNPILIRRRPFDSDTLIALAYSTPKGLHWQVQKRTNLMGRTNIKIVQLLFVVIPICF